MTDKLDVRDIAKLVRGDIAEAMRAGKIPRVKTTVRIDRYSLGQSVRVRVAAVPDHFVIPNLARIAWEHEHPHDCAANAPEHARALLSPGAKQLVAQLELILARYNRESATNDHKWFHPDVGFDGELEAAQRAHCRRELGND